MTPNAATTLLRLKAEYLMPCVYHFYKDPPVIVRGEGAYLFDTTGKGYLDGYSGVSAMNAGHGNPAILDAIIAQLRQLQHTTTIYLTEPMFHLAKALADIAPGDLKRTFFCASGSEANETALLLATLHTERRRFIALSDALHGRTKWAMSATGLDLWRTDPFLLDDFSRAPRPFCLDCPLDLPFPQCGYACIDAIERILREVGPQHIAALIAEPIQGNGGIIVPPDGYWQRVRNLCNQHGILLIFDEVQTAMNRTGAWFASEHWDVVPDIVTISKALGNGLPIAATITTDIIAAAYTRPGAATFGANPVSCAAALAVLEFHARERLGDNARARGDQLLAGLTALSERSPCFARPRGKGLMIGVDLVTPESQPDAAGCDSLLERLKDNGILAGKTGSTRNTLTFMPPLIITSEEIDTLLDALSISL
ncbi:MAG: aspartate aminotransferase family protein [Candidatus Hydrogenedentes bacterium]|nr:aspartate aminotransferase family protein [Candidatus Hydrogenedentota bacterium]